MPRHDDDLLALMFIACHPVLSREASVALTLRVLRAFTSDEIAPAFLVPTATVQARITRPKKTIVAAQVHFAVPPPDKCRKRVGSVLSVLYLIFTEGSTASSRTDWIGADLAREAVRLTRILERLVPDESEAHGLLALLELTAARAHRACVTTANRCLWSSRTFGVGTGRRSGAGGHPWSRPGCSVARVGPTRRGPSSSSPYGSAGTSALGLIQRKLAVLG